MLRWFEISDYILFPFFSSTFSKNFPVSLLDLYRSLPHLFFSNMILFPTLLVSIAFRASVTNILLCIGPPIFISFPGSSGVERAIVFNRLLLCFPHWAYSAAVIIPIQHVTCQRSLRQEDSDLHSKPSFDYTLIFKYILLSIVEVYNIMVSFVPPSLPPFLFSSFSCSF